MNGLATALDTAADKCSQTIKRSVAAPSPEYRRTTSFCQNRICEKYLTVPEVGLTQGELAEKADISVVHLSNIELGKKTPGLSTLICIAEALDVATDWILRANTPGTYAVANEKIGELLADCTNDEMLSILRILEEVKNAMRHN